jgi:hypothetical protein
MDTTHDNRRAHYDAWGATVRFENNFDGTKLPMVVSPSPDHKEWYELKFSRQDLPAGII